MSDQQNPTPTTARHAARAAADWWAKAVGAPTFRAVDENSGPDDQRRMGLAGTMASMVAGLHPVSEGSGAKFAEVLAGAVETTLRRAGKWGVSLDVDYGPCRTLHEAATAAGVNGSRFPWKTNMRITTEHVTVSAGYRAADRLVWASDAWLANRPICPSQGWDETLPYSEDYNGEPFRCSLPQYHDEPHKHDRPIALCSVCGSPEDRSSHGVDRQYTRDPHDFAPLPAGQAFQAVAK